MKSIRSAPNCKRIANGAEQAALKEAVAMNAVHHGIYAIGTACAVRFLDRRSERQHLSAA
jgi:hypothetical protein